MKKRMSMAVLFLLILLNNCAGFDPQAYVPGLYTPTPSPTSSVTPTPTTALSTATTATLMDQAIVCTNIPEGKLHVRFAPGEESVVRGYLLEGEMGLMSQEHQMVHGNIWVKLRSPIVGWVNAAYLCEGKL